MCSISFLPLACLGGIFKNLLPRQRATVHRLGRDEQRRRGKTRCHRNDFSGMLLSQSSLALRTREIYRIAPANCKAARRFLRELRAKCRAAEDPPKTREVGACYQGGRSVLPGR